MLTPADLPDDIAALKAMLIASEARNQRKDERIERLEKLVAEWRPRSVAVLGVSAYRVAFGRRKARVALTM